MATDPHVIIGSSHAALEAAAAIRQTDSETPIVMLAKDDRPPYSPTVLPYVVSGRSDPGTVDLRDPAWFDANAVDFRADNAVTAVVPEHHKLTLASGEALEYGKLLLATGAAPAVPPIPGLDQVPFHTLRSMADAQGLRAGFADAKRAAVLGAGLVGMHAAENLAEAGLAVTIVEMREHVLPAYFDRTAAAMIEAAFTAHGAEMRMGRAVTEVQPLEPGCRLLLDDGEAIDCDLLLVATGVLPVIDYLDGSGIACDAGVLVDDLMRTNTADIWAAGDVAQARDFFRNGTSVIGILPNAVEQGRIAGMDMAGDDFVKPYPGGVPINTYRFFGQQALSVGLAEAGDDNCEVVMQNADGRYAKIILRDGCLQGISGINTAFDTGIMWQLILRRIDLEPVKDDFLAAPMQVGRRLMSQNWR